MAKRTVAIGGMTYLGPGGFPLFANHGEEVEVQPDDLERFDRLNTANPEPKPEPKKAPAPKPKG